MKELKILHLFPQLLSLYGEYGNVAVLKNTLEIHGHSVTVDHYETGEPELTGYDFIYVGSGTEANLLEAAKRLQPYGELIRKSIQDGQIWLATGNAMSLFGNEIRYRDAVYTAVNAFPYSTSIDASRFMGDVLTADAFGAPLNTSCVYRGINDSLLELQLGNKLGNDKQDAKDGIHVTHFYGTQLIGPVLTKNPHFLQHLCKEVTGEDVILDPESNICKAYQISLSELTKRLENSK